MERRLGDAEGAVPAIQGNARPRDEHGAAPDKKQMLGHFRREDEISRPGRAGGPEQVDHQRHGAADADDRGGAEGNDGNDEEI